MEDMKDKYERLSRKIQDAVKKGIPPYNLTGDLAVFSNIERRNHPSIIKIIWENKEGLSDGLPRLIYVSREKRLKHPHHYKAGAMNVLYFGRGMNGIQGPCYGGTGCFHRRKVIYGLCPDEVESKASNLTSVTGNLAYEELQKIFGNSTEFIKSAAQALQGKTNIPNTPSNLVEAAAYQVAGCGYEYGTGWGTEVGWQYGSNTEDVLTGMKIHSRGWKSKYCNPDPPAFLGCAPSGGPSTLTQQKRWAIGLLEILICKNNPTFHTITAKLQFGQCLAYMWILVWALRSIPELCYVMLPAYCLITNSNFLPKVHEPAFYGYVALFLIYILYTISEYLETGLSIRAWWNRQRMTIITSTSAWLFAILSVILKILGISETVFEITRKEESTFTDDGDAEEDYEVPPLPGNPTMAQIKTHKEKKTKKSKAKNCLFAAVSPTIFSKIISLGSAKAIWDFLKNEYKGDERIRGMKVLNLVREFEMQHMKESETVKVYVERLSGIANKVRILGAELTDNRIVQKILVSLPERYEATIASLENTKDLSKISLAELVSALQAQEQRRVMRQEGTTEGALQAKW
ncbi:hypothetical protein GH714_017923 [Hevea brasiliensis]|uniref:Uncharacterized protein n=1 Tax=Hevea brasiliensis TaxID=3981 RepID=A0A6A6KW98_HEVBR|nr:hypothetical protein GH714_017923 [Hevea brasiliensis]